MSNKSQGKNRGIVPNTGRNLPNMKVGTPIPPVKPPKPSEGGKKNG
ncbi:hypothetical protein V4F55_001007 [Vibrio parahaemolyticus]|nr:hypothetical protein [Vibrio parahaemolyticus]EJG2230158.1 hypothetical protein [Vibrio parahaemolyticus]ELA9390268.1 hypothetical protein [Vibrio parahaemolyticus]ELA9873533.1 hypothetical protein [Vibrio parahaemolyticus]MCF9447827.1 hypothetical protein [Vibrio parahaemolyticus]